MSTLLSKIEFKNKVFQLSQGKCIFCDKKAEDAHHIIDQKLWKDGGHYLENGSPLCENHHILAERGIITPNYIRQACNHQKNILPDNLDSNQDYNKWGQILNRSTREKYIKYPSTLYFSFSPDNDTSEYFDSKYFIDCPVIITIKMDGSNVSLTREKISARNGDSAFHPSFDMLKSLHSVIKHSIPDNIQIFGEWLYARHSIHYKDHISLEDYLQVFAVYDTNTREFLDWKSTQEIATMIGCITVPVICYNEIFNKQIMFITEVSSIAEELINQGHEGIVVRSCFSFHYGEFSKRIAKVVRPNHVQTSKHWSAQQIIKNAKL